MTTTARDVLIAPSGAARAYLMQRADLGAPINYDGLGRAALIATFRKLAEDGPTEAMLEMLAHYHPVERDEAIGDFQNMMQALLRELEGLTP